MMNMSENSFFTKYPAQHMKESLDAIKPAHRAAANGTQIEPCGRHIKSPTEF